MHTFTRWVATPENRSAFLAVRRVAECLSSGRRRREINPLFLHGPAGTGKTHLVSALAAEVSRHSSEQVVALRADALAALADPAGHDEFSNENAPADYPGGLLVVEDLQHLRAEAAELLVQTFDRCHAHQRQMVFTAHLGPAQFDHLPARFVSRLASGLVVGLELLGPSSRLAFLQDRTQRRQLPVDREVLVWLADNIGGSGRQLEGAVARLEELVRLRDRLPDRETVRQYFQAEADASRLTVERIADRVSRYYRIDRRQLRSRQRSRSALVPRQVGMYLARRFTALSLEQIGTYFGGRDHSTVLHACRKIDRALGQDPTLSGAVRHLQADLG